MNKLVSLGLIVGGGFLIYYGIHAMDSFSSDVSRFFTGSPTDKSVWLLIGGGLAVLAGISGVTFFRSSRAQGLARSKELAANASCLTPNV